MKKHLLVLVAAVFWCFGGNPAHAVLVTLPTWHTADATQSSLASGGVPARAVDGNTNGAWSANSVTHTDGTAAGNAWWMFDLLTTQPIYEVDLYNRTDCCSGRLRDLTVEIYDYNNVLVDSFGPLNPENSLGGGLTNFGVGPANPITLRLPEASVGRYVKIIRNEADVSAGGTVDDRHVLSLAEVQMYTDNLGLYASASQSSTLSASYPAGNALDLNMNNFTHTNIASPVENTENPSWWMVDLGTSATLDSVILNNRLGCCGGRLRDITVEVLDAGMNVVYTSPELNNDNVLGGGINDYTTANSPLYLTVDFHQLSSVPVVGQYLRVNRAAAVPGGAHNEHVLSLGEVQVFGTLDAGGNLAYNKPTTQSSTLDNRWDFVDERAVDGRLNDTTHTSAVSRTSSPLVFWQVDLQDEYLLTDVEIYNRGDGCCQGRLRDITVKVLDDQQQVVYTSALLNPGNAMGGGAGEYNLGPAMIALDLTGLGVWGSIVRVERTADPNAPDDYAGTVLSLGEVKVYGLVPEPGAWLLAMLGLAGVFLIRNKKRS
jgi:hypothetical protein